MYYFQIFFNEEGKYPAIVFAEDEGYIFLVSEKIKNTDEELMFTCPPTEDEIESFFTTSSESSQDEENSLTANTAPLENKEVNPISSLPKGEKPPKTQSTSQSPQIEENSPTATTASLENKVVKPISSLPKDETPSKTQSPKSEVTLQSSSSEIKSSSISENQPSNSLPLKNNSAIPTYPPVEAENKLEISLPKKDKSFSQPLKQESSNTSPSLSKSKSSSSTQPKGETKSPKSPTWRDRLTFLKSKKDNAKLQSSPSKKNGILPKISLLSTKKEQPQSASSSEEDDSSSKEVMKLPKPNYHRVVLPSEARPTDVQCSANVYYCEEDYKPQTTFIKNCRRFGENDAEENGELYSVGYKVQIARNQTTKVEKNLFVYAKCYSYDLQKPLFVMYKIISFPSRAEELQPMNNDFDPRNIEQNIIAPYHFDTQGQILKRLDGKIKDKLIPRRLIPPFSISTDFSRGAVSDDGEIYSPQWMSKAQMWDDLSRIVFKYGKKQHWLIYTGTVGTCNSEMFNNPIVLEQETGPNLHVPLHWWTLIMKINSTEGRGIIIGMLNVPQTTRQHQVPKNVEKLCITDNTCREYGWEEIMTAANSPFLICCRVRSALTQQLMGESIHLNVLSLENEKKKKTELRIANVRPQDKAMQHQCVNVSSLLDDLNSFIKNNSKKDKKAGELTTSSPSGLPTGASSPSSSSSYSSPSASPDHKAEVALPNLSHSQAVHADDRQREEPLSPDDSDYTSALSNIDDETNQSLGIDELALKSEKD
ncbi:uncharacterized protein LOC135840803 [Planococcus citri]|uniref:uncharacterized protein LOC135840803 n=1 Tax=Planococcus citri TaxID=170843 RepID=UPI0031FA0BD5